MEVGTVVTLRVAMLGEDANAVGVVFNKYDGGVQVIFERGGFDGFSDTEQKEYLVPRDVDKETSSYIFKNVMQVDRDYEMGRWGHVFANSKYKMNKHF